MSKSTRKRSTNKPAKPYPGFPLFPHATRRWAKKIRGKLHYFGPWDDPDGALQRYLDQRDDLHAGRTPRRVSGDGLTVADLANRFLTHKKCLLDSGELAPRSFQRYYIACETVVNGFGKRRLVEDLVADDFQTLRAGMAKRWGPIALANEIQMVRSIFRYGYEAGHLDKPIRFGPGFKKPSAKTIRQARVKGGLRMFERDEAIQLLDHAGPNMRAMILLGLNAGLGNTDVGMLPIKAVNLKTGWVDYPRPKTGMPRRVPLWPETIDAIRDMLAVRRKPADPADKDLLFIGNRGTSYVGNHKGYRVTQEMTRLFAVSGVAREGLSFYSLRRTFQTIAEGAHDMVAVQGIMGHAPSSGDMSAIYRQRISDDRLQAVTEHVRRWLFPPGLQKSRIPSSKADNPVQ